MEKEPPAYYIDTSFLVAYYLKEGDKIKAIEEFLDFINQNSEIEFYTSFFTLTEMVKVLLDKEMDEAQVRKIAEQLSRKGRIGNVKIIILDVKEGESYDFSEFFYDIQESLLLYRPGLGDTIHAVIMKNWDLKDIITYNKPDFEMIEGINPLTPDEAIERDG